jgi:uncharacterized membrane protein
MQPWLLILTLWLLFAVTHTWPTRPAVRRRLIARLGGGGYLGLYTLVSFATLVPLIWVYAINRHAGVVLWNLRDIPYLWEAAFGISGLGFALSIASFFQPSPFAIGSPQRPEPYGLTRITRHPLFMPLALIGFGHLLLWGWLTDVAFFGGLAIYTIAGCAHQDARKRQEEHDRYATYFEKSSLLPFAAILTGRNRLSLRELPWVGLLVGAGAAFGFYLLHPVIFR